MAWLRACSGGRTKAKKYIYTIGANREVQTITLIVDGVETYNRTFNLVNTDTSYLYNDNYLSYHWNKSTDILTLTAKVSGNYNGANVSAGYTKTYSYTTTGTHTFIFEN